MIKTLTLYGELFVRRLTLFGVPKDIAERIAVEVRLTHQWGSRKRDKEFLQIGHLPAKYGLNILGLAEHIACVHHNWGRCHTVDTTELAMRARAA